MGREPIRLAAIFTKCKIGLMALGIVCGIATVVRGQTAATSTTDSALPQWLIYVLIGTTLVFAALWGITAGWGRARAKRAQEMQEGLKAQTAQVEADRAHTQETLRAAHQNLSQLNQQLTEATQAARSARADISRLQETATQAERDKTEALAEAEAIRKQLPDLRAALQAAEARAANAHKELAELRAKAQTEDLSPRVDQLEKALTNAHLEASTARAALATAQRELAAAQQALAAQITQVNPDELAALQEQLGDAQRAKVDLQRQIGELQADLLAARSTATPSPAAKPEPPATDQVIERLEAQLHVFKAIAAERKVESTALLEQIAELKAKLPAEPAEGDAPAPVAEAPSPATPQVTPTAAPNTNEEIVALRAELEARQNQLLGQGKMASLGQLVAGISHEINTPIGAINASYQNLHRSMPPSLQDLVRFMNTLNPGLHSRFFELLERCANSGPALSSRDERAYRKSVTEALESYNVPNAGEMAKALIRIGIYDNLSAFSELFRQHNAEEIIRVAESTGKLFFNVANIGLALGKIQKMLFALKNYSRKKVEEEAEEISIAETMDVVLTIYHNQLKYGIAVHRNFADGLPLVRCFADQLTQVWTNILHNAIQAMDGKGELTVDIDHWVEGNGVRVRMTDNGPGIPPEIQAKIWEPFFTTKPAGEGSGLGLDICRQIILRHGGTIEVQSEPGRTTFTVCIPQDMPALQNKD